MILASGYHGLALVRAHYMDGDGSVCPNHHEAGDGFQGQQLSAGSRRWEGADLLWGRLGGNPPGFGKHIPRVDPRMLRPRAGHPVHLLQSFLGPFLRPGRWR